MTVQHSSKNFLDAQEAKPVRVAFFTETFLPKVDGIVNTLCHLLEHLARRGHQSILFAPAGGPMRYAKTPIIGLPGYPFPLYPELKLVPSYVDVIKFLKTLLYARRLGRAGQARAEARSWPAVLDGLLEDYATLIPTYQLNQAV